MDIERPKSSSSFHQDEVFLTHENYKKYSCRPSFVEFLEKHLSSAKDGENTVQNNHADINTAVTTIGSLETAGHKMNKGVHSQGAETGGSNSAPAYLGPSMEFPFVSKVSIESQKMFLEVFEALRSGQLAKVDLHKMKAAQDIKNTVLIEQDEYQQFLHRHAKTNHHQYNFIHPDIWDYFKAEVDGKLKESTSKYPRHYSLHETIGLAAGAVFKTDAVLTFEQTLLQVGNVPKLCLPESTGVMLSEVSEVKRSSAVKTCSPKVVSEDPIAVSLAKKHKVDIVISSSGLNTLLDNHPPGYSKQWQLLITVKRQEDIQDKSSGHKTVFIDKPLPPQKVHAREVHEKFYKHALRRLVCQKSGEENTTTNDDTGRDSSSNVKATERLHSTGLELEKTEFEMRETDSDTRKRRATGQENGIVEQKKSKMAGESGANLPKESVSSSTNEEEKFFVYNLWRFGKLKLLIRCSVDAYRAEPNKPNCFTFFSVLPKLEYQANFGHEKLTCCEIARLWLHCYIRPNTKLICGRINVFNSELLRVDELFVNDILQQGAGFHPAQGMKMVFQVFQALKRLPESKFILSHKSGEIHGCLYKSMLSSSASLKSSYDFHKARTPVVVNYTEADIPWVAIDCNLFMPWQINQRRIPCTFPPVTAKELSMMAKQAQEAAAKNSNKKKKKKGKKKNKGKGKGFAPKMPNAGLATEQSRNANKEPRKPVNKSRLFASFYDTQPVEKESEVFAASRRASGPVIYDDLDF